MGDLGHLRTRELARSKPPHRRGLHAVGTRLAAGHAGVEDGRHVRHPVAVRVGHAERRSAQHRDDPAQLDRHARLLEGLAVRSLLRALVGLDHAANRLPQPGVAGLHHQDPSGVVARDHRHRRSEHQIVADLRTKSRQVGGDRHA
ncbi:MAG: hypothetical protein ABSB73_03805 [Solirubrobacteraceae bacterium]